MAKREGEKIAIGAAIAGVVGYVAGILTAPKSGKQTRKIIEGEVVEKKNEAEGEVKKANDELAVLIKKAKDQAKMAKGNAKVELDEALAQATEVRSKTKKLLVAAKNGEADDDEVARLLKDISKTVKHLKQYYKD